MNKLLIIPLLLLSIMAHSTNYFVSNSGNDSADGLTEITAWQTISKVNGFAFNPGDTIFFKRDNLWVEGLIVPGNGLVFSAYGDGAKPVFGNTISYAGWTNESANVYYTTGVVNPWFLMFNGTQFMNRETDKINLDANNDFYYTNDGADTLFIYLANVLDTSNIRGNKVKHGIDIDGKSNIIIDNLHLTKNGWHNIYIDNNADQITIHNCVLDSAGLQGIHPNKCTNYIIRNDSIMNNGNDGIYFNWSCNNAEVYDCYFYGNGINPSGADHQAIGMWHVSDVSIHDNYIEHHGKDGGVGIELTGWIDSLTNENISFYNNTFKYTGNGRMLSIFQGSYKIHNNLLIATDSAMYVMITGSVRDDALKPPLVDFYNNTCIGSLTSVRIYDNNDGKVPNDGVFNFKNNIFFNPEELYFRVSSNLVDSSEVNIDYNLYDTSVGNLWNFKNTYYDYDNWKSTSGFDTNTIVGDPFFVGSGLHQYSLQNNSPAINKGINVGLTKDILGNSIVGTPDIGAYEFLIQKLLYDIRNGTYLNVR